MDTPFDPQIKNQLLGFVDEIFIAGAMMLAQTLRRPLFGAAETGASRVEAVFLACARRLAFFLACDRLEAMTDSLANGLRPAAYTNRCLPPAAPSRGPVGGLRFRGAMNAGDFAPNFDGATGRQQPRGTDRIGIVSVKCLEDDGRPQRASENADFIFLHGSSKRSAIGKNTGNNTPVD